MIVIGLISGTSHDGVDVAAVDFRLGGDTLRGRLLAAATEPYPPRLRARLVAALPPATTSAEAVCRLDTELGQAFAAAAAGALARLPDGAADLLCTAGQTVFHGVEDGRVWGTLQLGQPAFLAEATGLPVVSGLRARDVAAGGHGAPLVSMLDVLTLAELAAPDPNAPVAALNLGGIANVTLVRPGVPPMAYDVGPANALIDAAMVRLSDGRASLDEGGRMAASGRVDGALLEELLAEPYYRRSPPKTTGKELFNGAYLDARAGGVNDADLVATLTALTAEVVARELCASGARRILVSGGGTHNETLMDWLAERIPPASLATTEALGLPVEAKEAMAFALIGWLTAHGLPGSVASCTGATDDRVLGSIAPGAGPLRLPRPVPMPTRLVMDASA